MSESLLYGIMTMSQTLAFAPTLATALIGVHRLFNIIDRTPLIESSKCAEKPNQKTDQIKEVAFKEIDFRYPTRPHAQILNGFNLKIGERQTVALVGPSGRNSNKEIIECLKNMV